MKKFLSFAVAFILLLSCFGGLHFTAFAAGESVLHFSKRQVEVGEEVTVTISVNADEAIYAVPFELEYDPSVLEFVKGDDCVDKSGVVDVQAPNGSGGKSLSLEFTFKAVKSGSCYISTKNMGYVNFDEKQVSVPNQGASMTVKGEAKSGDADLKSLSLNGGTLTPGFSATKTSYSVEVENGVTSCEISAAAADSSAKVKIVGGNNLKVGKNNCSVTVTAADGTQKVYNIVITRKNDASDIETEAQTSSEEEGNASSNEETSSEEVANEDNEKLEPLETVINGKKYFILNNLDGIQLPDGYNAQKSQYNEEEITIAVNNDQTHAIYFLGTKESDAVGLYNYDFELDTFSKLAHFRQGKKIYIFSDIPEGTEVPDGFYSTNTKINDFNVSCYSNVEQEFSAFYYVYCYNGEEYGFYRYDSIENVMQRYPELNLQQSAPMVSTESPTEEAGFIAKFNSLTTNAKIIVIGIVLVILAILALIVLFGIKVFYRRGETEFVTNLDYTEDFDSIEYNSAFDIEKSESFLTDDSEDDIAIEDTDIKSADEIESDYITEEKD